MTVYLVRHADAGDRDDWHQPDDLRPLSDEGRRQAAAIADLLADRPVTRVVSSPAVRCRGTVEPLAGRRAIEIELASGLDETADLDEALAVLEGVAGDDAVLSSHGELIPDMVRRLVDGGMAVDGDEGWDKGSTWVLEREDGRWARGRWLPAPEA